VRVSSELQLTEFHSLIICIPIRVRLPSPHNIWHTSYQVLSPCCPALPLPFTSSVIVVVPLRSYTRPPTPVTAELCSYGRRRSFFPARSLRFHWKALVSSLWVSHPFTPANSFPSPASHYLGLLLLLTHYNNLLSPWFLVHL
jgi:hypothetical protein